MPKLDTLALIAVLAALPLAFAAAPAAAATEDRAPKDFQRNDGDGDGRLSRAEWRRRGNFERLDTNGDGFLGLEEIRPHYGVPNVHGTPPWAGYAPPPAPSGPAEDGSVKKAKIASDKLSKETRCAIARLKKCDAAAATGRGLLATGLGPVFPKEAACQGIDDYFAMDYGFKRSRETYHGGIDMPAPFGMPMIAAAAGTVVGVFEGGGTKRGKEVVLRHAPEDTGLDMWTYSQYAHLDALPQWKVGRRVAMGAVIGPTGNSGISGRSGEESGKRRPAIHFAVWYSASDKYAVVEDVVVPEDGHWMDPLAFYRSAAPFESAALKALPEAQKGVAIPVVLMDGTTVPAKSRRIWPYPCRRDEAGVP